MIINVAKDRNDEIEELKHTMGYSAVVRKNLLENTASGGVAQNITYTVNDDKSVTANGTTSSNTASALTIGNAFKLPKGEYILSGCPEGGSTSKYYLEVTINNVSTKDMGSGVKFVIDDNTTKIYVNIRVWSNVTVSNLTFYPMIRRADITDDTYETYIEGKENVDSRFEWKLYATVSASIDTSLNNLFNKSYSEVLLCYGASATTNGSAVIPRDRFETCVKAGTSSSPRVISIIATGTSTSSAQNTAVNGYIDGSDKYIRNKGTGITLYVYYR